MFKNKKIPSQFKICCSSVTVICCIFVIKFDSFVIIANSLLPLLLLKCLIALDHRIRWQAKKLRLNKDPLTNIAHRTFVKFI